MKKIVIVMTYFNRSYQLSKTLHSLAHSKYDNFEVVVVDDGSTEQPSLGVASYPVTVLRTVNKKWSNAEPAINMGLAFALGKGAEVVIIQNAECYHVGDVVEAASKVTDDTYISFPCFSIDKETTYRNHDITALLMANPIGASMDGQNAWYNHAKYRPVAYDFCSAITASNIKKLNGFDERLSDGWGYGDNYFLERIKMLGIKVQIPDLPLVVHQWHYIYKLQDRAALTEKNRLLYLQLLRDGEPRATHKYTSDL